jgi:1-acyl-sn-glycerol-3-phosphate acyltransferase
MMGKIGDSILDAIEGMTDEEVLDKVKRLDTRLNEFGVDPFGFDPKFVKYGIPFALAIYRKYFRVEPKGLKNVPAGRVLLISNHSGQIPLDAAMICTAMIVDAEPPRMVRSMVETWVPTLPILSWFFPRVGQIVGTRENCQRLLEREEAILAFPEGVRGISKTFAKRYQLEEFGLGFMRLALMTGAPVVPVAVVGAEEQIPSFISFKPLAKLMGAPAFPVTPTFPWLGPLGILPLPVKYRIHFGKPMYFSGDPEAEDEVVGEKVKQVRRTIQRMLRDGLKARKNVFW